MKISFASDHGGLDLKNGLIEYAKSQGIEVVDNGCYNYESCDYPDFAKKTCLDVVEKRCDFGVLVCTTGIGMSMCANKVRGCRGSLVSNTDSAFLTRSHNDSNVLCLSQKYTPIEVAKEIFDIYISTPFSGGRHLRRVEKLED